MKEEWKDIDGFDGMYRISNKGNIYSLISNKILKTSDNGKGYMSVRLVDKNGIRRVFYAHRLVATYFIDNPYSKPEVNHKDLNKKNNCVDNLEWVTKKENAIHYKGNGIFKGVSLANNGQGKNYWNARMTGKSGGIILSYYTENLVDAVNVFRKTYYGIYNRDPYGEYEYEAKQI